MQTQRFVRCLTVVQVEVELTGLAEVPEYCWVQAVKMNGNTPCATHATAVTRSLATSTAPHATRGSTQMYEVREKNADLSLALGLAQATNATKPKRHCEFLYAWRRPAPHDEQVLVGNAVV